MGVLDVMDDLSSCTGAATTLFVSPGEGAVDENQYCSGFVGSNQMRFCTKKCLHDATYCGVISHNKNKFQPNPLCCFICSTSASAFVKPMLTQSDVTLKEIAELISSSASVEDFCILFRNYQLCQANKKDKSKINLAKTLSFAKVLSHLRHPSPSLNWLRWRSYTKICLRHQNLKLYKSGSKN
eukprot:13043328-Ditylum_brightwellii.AAC.1